MCGLNCASHGEKMDAFNKIQRFCFILFLLLGGRLPYERSVKTKDKRGRTGTRTQRPIHQQTRDDCPSHLSGFSSNTQVSRYLPTSIFQQAVTKEGSGGVAALDQREGGQKQKGNRQGKRKRKRNRYCGRVVVIYKAAARRRRRFFLGN